MSQTHHHKKTVRLPLPDDLKQGTGKTEEQEAAAEASVHHYYVFAEDHQVYGPATISLLLEWCEQGLVSNETWVFDETANEWKIARRIKKIQQALPVPVALTEVACGDVTMDQVRRIRVFSDMDDHQLAEIMAYLTKVQIPAFRPVVHKGEHGSSMFLLLTGEAIVSTRVDGAKKVLSTLRIGDFFGENTLIEVGPRPHEVMTNVDCVFLRLKYSDFQKLLQKHSDITARFLTAVVRHLSYLNLHTTERFAQAKALVRSSLSKTGEIHLPPIVHKKILS